MSTNETPIQTLARMVSSLTGEDPAVLTEDTAVQDIGIEDEEYRRLFTDAGQAHGVDISDIINTMPIYRTASDNLLWSLRLISAFSPAPWRCCKIVQPSLKSTRWAAWLNR